MSSSNDITRELRNSITSACNEQKLSMAQTDLAAVRGHIEHLQSVGAHEEAHVVRHQVAIALRELDKTLPVLEAVRTELREVAGKKAIDIANAPMQRIER